METPRGLVGGKHIQTADPGRLPCTDYHTAPGNLRSRRGLRPGHDREASKEAGRGQPHGAEVSENGWGIDTEDVQCSEEYAAVAAVD